MLFRVRALLVCAVLTLAGCGGGGGGASAPGFTPSTPGTTVPLLSKGSLVLDLGSSTNASAKSRRTLFLSPSARSVVVAVSGVIPNVVADISATSPICTGTSAARTCAISVAAPAGAQTFTVTLFDGANGSGNALGTGSATQTIAMGTPFSVAIGVTGNVASIQLVAARTQFPAGAAATTSVTVTALDAGGSAITGTYTAPVNLTASDTTGAFSISPATVTASGQTVTVSYSGSTASTGTTITAAAANVAATNVRTQVLTVGTPALASVSYALPNGSVPNQITLGPDGNVWFGDTGTPQSVGRITTAGVVSEFTVPTDPLLRSPGSPFGITSGPDGKLYTTDYYCGVYATTTAGVSTFLNGVSACQNAGFITLGPDGALWFMVFGNGTGGNAVARVTTSGALTTYPLPTANALLYFAQIVTGPDGALWFTEPQGNKIGRITTAGAITEFPLPTAGSFPEGIVSAPDGALWFCENGTGRIGRLTTAGAITEFTLPNNNRFPRGLTVARDGNLYFSSQAGIGKVNMAGAITIYSIPGTGNTGDSIATGSDGKLYTVIQNTGNQYQMVVYPPQ